MRSRNGTLFAMEMLPFGNSNGLSPDGTRIYILVASVSVFSISIPHFLFSDIPLFFFHSVDPPTAWRGGGRHSSVTTTTTIILFRMMMMILVMTNPNTIIICLPG
mmetsp:Transcript_42738/g.47781  ORF Transcript_42738/g.47781 Transcript_42738/m.47781 type:complete len:105 (-) Transcript_42738:462-776(-)